MPKSLFNVREDILRISRIMLSESGYNSLTIRSVASRCGIGMGTIYNYFRSKQEIVGALIRSDWEVMLRKMDHGIRSGNEPTGQLGIIYDELQHFMTSTRGIWFGSIPEELKQIGFEHIHEGRRGLESQLAERVRPILMQRMQQDEADKIASMIIRLFISYTYEGDVGFDYLTGAIRKLIE